MELEDGDTEVFSVERSDIPEYGVLLARQGGGIDDHGDWFRLYTLKKKLLLCAMPRKDWLRFAHELIAMDIRDKIND